jgi:hypothetical protein
MEDRQRVARFSANIGWREPLCDRAHVELLLGAGSAAYEHGCAQFISTLAAMGLASRQSSQSVSDVHC